MRLNPADVEYIEADKQIGMYFVYFHKDFMNNRIEPAGHAVNALTYNRLMRNGVPTLAEYLEGKRSPYMKNASANRQEPRKIVKHVVDIEFDNDNVIISNDSLNTKVCPICNKSFSRSEFPDLTDTNWNSKVYCSKACSKRSKKQKHKVKMRASEV